jgi:hypothetical protein
MQDQSRSASRPTSGFTQRLKEDGRRTLEQRKLSAAARVDVIAQALERTRVQFTENDEPTLAELISRLSGTVGNLATRLREGTVEDLLDDTRAFARRNPGLFIAAGVLAGFAVARFAKASAQRPLEAAELDEADLDDADVSTDSAPTLMDEVDDVAPLPRGP